MHICMLASLRANEVSMGSGQGFTLMDRIRRRPVLFILAVAALLFYITPFYYYKSPYVAFPLICKNASCPQAAFATAGMAQSLWDMESHPGYVVFSSGCKIMDMDPFDKSVRKFLHKGKSVICSHRIAKLEDQKLFMDEEFAKIWKSKKPSCCYRAIHRVTQQSDKYNKYADWEVRYSDICHHIPFGPEGILLNHTFVRIECQHTGKSKGMVEFHGMPKHPTKYSKSTKRKAKYWDERKTQGLPTPPSILIIGIDSISRLHLLRSLPKTNDFLRKNDFIELKGYNKVGENTFPNIMAGFAGMELNNYSSCWPNKSAKLDDCPFIWKNFSDLNYLTAFLEDAPGIAIFNYMKVGFVLPPADYYMRPLTAAIHRHYGWYKGSGRASCVGGNSPTDYQANFIKELIAKMGKDYPYFLFSWFTSVGHDDFNGLKTADDAFLNLFTESMSNARGNPDNTIIIFMSDHGYRFGRFRETFLGFYEESLPFFYIRLPRSLKEAHPDWYASLKRNSKQLTSPLDLHSTLKQILNYAQSDTLSNHKALSSPNIQLNSFVDIQLLSSNELITNVTEYTFDNTISSNSINQQHRARYSFFEFIPPNRTCESSSIPQRYCMCGVTPAMSRISSISSHLGDIVISHINFMLQSVIKSGKCATLKFAKFLYGREVGHGEIWNNFNQLINFKDYIVALEASPSKAHFESKIRILQNSTTRILGDITRINSYHGQSDCVPDFKLKSYCFCSVTSKHSRKFFKPKHIAPATKHKPRISSVATTPSIINTTIMGLINPTKSLLLEPDEHVPNLNDTKESLTNLSKGTNNNSVQYSLLMPPA